MWQSLKEWARACGQGWWAVVSGLVSAMAGLLQDLVSSGVLGPVAQTNIIVPSWVWYLAAVLGLLSGSLVAFHRMRVERDAARSDLKEWQARRPKPELTGSVYGIIAGPEGEKTAIMVQLGVQNTGPMPSIVRKWGLSLKLPDGRWIAPTLHHLDRPMTFQIPGQKTKTYEPSSFIYEKTTTVPIEV